MIDKQNQNSINELVDTINACVAEFNQQKNKNVVDAISYNVRKTDKTSDTLKKIGLMTLPIVVPYSATFLAYLTASGFNFGTMMSFSSGPFVAIGSSLLCLAGVPLVASLIKNTNSKLGTKIKKTKALGYVADLYDWLSKNYPNVVKNKDFSSLTQEDIKNIHYQVYTCEMLTNLLLQSLRKSAIKRDNKDCVKIDAIIKSSNGSLTQKQKEKIIKILTANQEYKKPCFELNSLLNKIVVELHCSNRKLAGLEPEKGWLDEMSLKNEMFNPTYLADLYKEQIGVLVPRLTGETLDDIASNNFGKTKTNFEAKQSKTDREEKSL